MPKPPKGPSRTLNDMCPGRRARIRRHLGRGAVRQRLMDLGLMPNVDVTLVRCAPLGDPIELKLEATSLTLRRHEARTIEIFDDE